MQQPLLFLPELAPTESRRSTRSLRERSSLNGSNGGLCLCSPDAQFSRGRWDEWSFPRSGFLRSAPWSVAALIIMTLVPCRPVFGICGWRIDRFSGSNIFNMGVVGALGGYTIFWFLYRFSGRSQKGFFCCPGCCFLVFCCFGRNSRGA